MAKTKLSVPIKDLELLYDIIEELEDLYEPLNDVEITDLQESLCPFLSRDTLVEIIRAVEKMHGIE